MEDQQEIEVQQLAEDQQPVIEDQVIEEQKQPTESQQQLVYYCIPVNYSTNSDTWQHNHNFVTQVKKGSYASCIFDQKELDEFLIKTYGFDNSTNEKYKFNGFYVKEGRFREDGVQIDSIMIHIGSPETFVIDADSAKRTFYVEVYPHLHTSVFDMDKVSDSIIKHNEEDDYGLDAVRLNKPKKIRHDKKRNKF